MNILFICKHNRFRSKVAEAFFNKYNKNKKDKARSRGIIKDIDAAKSVIKVMKEKKINLKDKKSRRLSKKDIKWADLTIIAADNVNKNIFKGKKVIVWKISDISQDNVKGIRKRVNLIKERVIKLLKETNNH